MLRRILGGIYTTKNRFLKEVLDWLFHIAVAIAIGVLIVTYVAQVTKVNGESMEGTLYNNDRLIIEKISPRLGRINRGDIVTIDVSDMESFRNSPLIKRVIGIAGDLVEVRDGKVYVNDVLLEEKYISGEITYANEKYSRVVVPEGFIYVMGDNRNIGKSNDSRFVGPLELKRVGGKAVLRFLPLNRFGFLE